eukprot:m.1246541 g.1246541  ORF g.1246541 m.1246541 type:complete len:1114 (-) comp24687_c0_seq2:942-4283(-)
MRINLRHVAQLAVANPDQNIKSGWLLMSEKAGQQSKKRWVVLKANYIFYFKKDEQVVGELVGAILLEKFRHRPVDEATCDFALSFDAYGQQSIFFKAENSIEYKLWIEAIRSCSYEYKRIAHALLSKRAEFLGFGEMKFDPFKTYADGTEAELAAMADYKLMGPVVPRDHLTDTNVTLRISISAQGLIGPKDVVPNTYVQLQAKYMTWFDFHKTEIRRDLNPKYTSEAVFHFEYSLTERMRGTPLRFIVYMDDGMDGSTPKATGRMNMSNFRPVASADCYMFEIVDADKKLKLDLMKMDNGAQKSGEFLLLNLKDLAPMEQDTRNGAKDKRASQVVRLGRKVEGPIYKFPTVEGGELRAREVMGESAYFRVVPISLLDIFLIEDTERVRDLESLVGVLGGAKYHDLVEPVCAQIHARKDLYVERKKALYEHESPHFRPSVDKKKRELEFTAINCHIQRFVVFGADVQQPVATYDTITHGAPAAHSLGFKQGGLWRMLQQDRSVDGAGERAQRDKSKRHRLQIAQILSKVREALQTLHDRFPLDGQQHAGKDSGACADVAVPRAASARGAVDGSGESTHVPGSTSPGQTSLSAGEATAGSNSDEAHADGSTATPTSAALDQPRRQQSKEEYFGPGDIDVHESAVRELQLLAELLDADVITHAVREASRLRMSGPVSWAAMKTSSSDEDDDADDTDDADGGRMSDGGSMGKVSDGNPFAGASDAHPRQRRGGGSLETGQAHGFVQLKAELFQMLATLEQVQVGTARTVLATLKRAVGLAEQTVQEADRLMILSELLTRGEAGAESVLVLRRDIAFSQACTILVTSVVSLLMMHGRDPVFLKQLTKVGLLVQFESLLSTQGNEMGMIEDMAQATKDLEGVVFKLECAAVDKDALEKVVVTGKRYRMCITIHVHAALFNRLPDALRDGATISVNPVFFTHGVNEMQTIANKIGETELQGELCVAGFNALARYTKKYQQFLKTVEGENTARTIATLDVELGKLERAIKSSKAKNLEILLMAEHISRSMKGARLTCCKSGKDRTGMSVTLEQCNLLIRNHKMDKAHLQDALNLMRGIGVRMDNVEKNIGDRRYAFNKLQMYALPKLLRPPIMKTGASVT